MAIEYTESAAKHGLTQPEATHVMLNYRWKVEKFGEPRLPGLPAPDLYIGASPSGQMLEVMSYRQEPRDLVIFHVMPLRTKIRNQALDELERRSNQQ
ncbi:hypothetical protein NBM05_03685 [Rothia sp. AR01]|uniref:Uncharacterized protein n=1 Tax=Rothia santali TaxID=2949643 RepID=A0A9X2HBP6_9MICC|nr:hypothetical protein [Rothia santali]MCP3425150.1 hypothetical protein [Rothia santali]